MCTGHGKKGVSMQQPNWVPLSRPTFTTGFDWFNTSIGQNADGRLELFLLGSDGVLGHCWQLAAGKSSWSEWVSLGKPSTTDLTKSVSLGRNGDGQLQIFVSGSTADGSNGRLWHTSQFAPGTNSWSNWSAISLPPGGITVVPFNVWQNADGGLEVFASGFKADNSNAGIWHTWQPTPNGTWVDWDFLGEPPNTTGFSGSALATNADGRLEIFAIGSTADGSNGRLWHCWQLAGGTSTWSTWSAFSQPPGGVSIGTPVVVSNADGRLEVFVATSKAGGSDAGLWHTWQLAPNGSWSEWTPLATTPVAVASNPAVAKNKDGRFEIFVTDAHANLWHSWQLAPGKIWSEWTSLGKPPDLQPDTWPTIPEPVVVENADGCLEVFLAGQTTFWHIWQLSPGGSWDS
jgi:hypothetical protein